MMIFYFGKITNRARNLEIKIKKSINNDKYIYSSDIFYLSYFLLLFLFLNGRK